MSSHRQKIFNYIIIQIIICFCIGIITGCVDDTYLKYQEENTTKIENSSETEFSSTASESRRTYTSASKTTSKATSKTTVKKTSTSKKTAATTSSIPKNNAADVKNPDYKSKYYIVVYTGSQSTVVYGKDSTGAYNIIYQSFTCSTGKSSSPTRTGMYKVKSKYRWRLLVGNVYGQYSSGIGSNYLFHSVPYKQKSVSSLDNAEYDKLGSPASHGCIRLCVRDSKWIYDNVPIGTQVNIVSGSGPAGAPVPQRNPNSLYNGWDPSDKWAAGNPYFTKQTTTSTTTTPTTTSTTPTATSTIISTTTVASTTVTTENSAAA